MGSDTAAAPRLTAKRRAPLTAARLTRLRWREPAPAAAVALTRWMDSWRGLGAVVVGMIAQGFNIELKRLTGNGDVEVARMTLGFGAFAYIVKPFDSAHLCRVIEAAVVSGLSAA